MRFIGCKTLLLDQIKRVIDENEIEANNFCDIFSGTASVARYFKQWYEVYSNDLLYFSYILQRGTIENDMVPKFSKLKKALSISDPIEYLNSLATEKMESLPISLRFFQNNYAPVGGRMYITDDNALRIDYVRNELEKWYNNKFLSDNEYYYLLACIIEGIPFVSNTSGTYGAFHKTWDRRSYKKYELYPLPVTSNGKKNKCFNLDGVELLDSLSGDILYVDPPYNSRQYLPNYHVLETAAKYDSPKLKGVTGQREYENQKSDFCIKRNVYGAFESLIKKAQFKHIILSYSTDGLMSVEQIKEIMHKYGKPETLKVYEVPYRRYKSRNLTLTNQLKELLIYIEK